MVARLLARFAIGVLFAGVIGVVTGLVLQPQGAGYVEGSFYTGLGCAIAYAIDSCINDTIH